MSWTPRSNGYDLSRLTPYKYDLRRGCQRLYVGSEVKGGSVLRSQFLVRDLQGNLWVYSQASALSSCDR